MGWEFKLPQDEAFVAAYPRVVANAQLEWQQQAGPLIEHLQAVRSRHLQIIALTGGIGPSDILTYHLTLFSRTTTIFRAHTTSEYQCHC